MFKDLSEKAFCDKYLKFVQLLLNRYKEDISTEQKDALMELCRVHVHAQVSYYRGFNIALDGPGCQFPWSQEYQPFNTVSTSIIQVTPLYYGQFPWSQTYQSFNTVSTSKLQAPVYHGQFLCPEDTYLQPVSTSIIQISLYYGQFSWSQRYQTSCD